MQIVDFMPLATHRTFVLTPKLAKDWRLRAPTGAAA